MNQQGKDHSGKPSDYGFLLIQYYFVNLQYMDTGECFHYGISYQCNNWFDIVYDRCWVYKGTRIRWWNMYPNLMMHIRLGAYVIKFDDVILWWRHQIEAFSSSLALCEGNSPVTDGFPSQRLVMPSFEIFDFRLNKRLGKQLWRRWFEAPSRSLLRHCNAVVMHARLRYLVIFMR